MSVCQDRWLSRTEGVWDVALSVLKLGKSPANHVELVTLGITVSMGKYILHFKQLLSSQLSEYSLCTVGKYLAHLFNAILLISRADMDMLT